jgi:hypothetical protein
MQGIDRPNLTRNRDADRRLDAKKQQIAVTAIC